MVGQLSNSESKMPLFTLFFCAFFDIFLNFFFAPNLKLSVNYLKNSFPCSKNYLICLNLSLNTPYFTSVFPSQWSFNLMAVILLVIVLLWGGDRRVDQRGWLEGVTRGGDQRGWLEGVTGGGDWRGWPEGVTGVIKHIQTNKLPLVAKF